MKSFHGRAGYTSSRVTAPHHGRTFGHEERWGMHATNGAEPDFANGSEESRWIGGLGNVEEKLAIDIRGIRENGRPVKKVRAGLENVLPAGTSRQVQLHVVEAD